MTESTFLSHLTSAAIVVYALQLLKRLPLYRRVASWLPIADGWVHRVVALGGAAVSAFGIHVAVEGTAAAGWHLGVTVPPMLMLLHAAWDWLNAAALQQLIFDGIKPKADAEVTVKLPSSLPSTVPVVLLAVVLGFSAFGLVACASSQVVHIAVAADTALVSGLHQLKVDEARAYQSGLYSKAKHDQYLTVIVQADRDAQAITDGIDTWRAAGGNAATVPAIITTARAGLQRIVDDLSAAPANTGLVVSLKAVLALLN